MMERLFHNMPDRIARLPKSDKGFPIPYFAEEVNGVRDFRVVSAERMVHAVRNDLCWVCGVRLGAYKAFVSALNCPFLSRPLAKRRADGLPEDSCDAPGFSIKRNPGATGVWITKSYRPFRPDRRQPGILFELGDPVEVHWYANGRSATRAEVTHSIETGIHHLEELAQAEGQRAVIELHERRVAAEMLLPFDVASLTATGGSDNG
jgi:hypothetical protein